ncbi:MAG: c-type cytochrome domain-containing protein [Pirellulales bacterium]
MMSLKPTRDLLFSLLTTALVLGSQPLRAAKPVSFLKDVAPILMTRCAGCHGPKKSSGDFRAHTFEFLTTAGASDESPVVQGKPRQSLLFQRIIESDTDLRMPQDDDPLSKTEIETIRQWISEGATFDGGNAAASFSSLMPPREHPPAPQKYRVAVPVFAVTFSPDGKQIATSGYNEVLIWDSASGELERRIGNLPQRIQEIKWIRDDHLLVGGGTPGEYGEVSLVNLASGKREAVFGTFDDIVLDVDINSREDRIAAGSAGLQSRVYNRTTGEMVWQAQVHSDWVTGVAFSPDGAYVVTTSRDQTAKVHETESGILFTTYNGHRKQLGSYTGRFSIYDIAFDPKSGNALTIGEGKALRIWNPVQAQKENGDASDMEGRFFKKGHTRFIEHKGPAEGMFAVSIAAGKVFTTGANGVARVFEFTSGEMLREFPGHEEWVYCVGSVADGSVVATGTFAGVVRVMNVESGRVVTSFEVSP